MHNTLRACAACKHNPAFQALVDQKLLDPVTSAEIKDISPFWAGVWEGSLANIIGGLSLALILAVSGMAISYMLHPDEPPSICQQAGHSEPEIILIESIQDQA